MSPTDRKKMCSECEGMIPFSVDVCPYCTAEQAPAENEAVAKALHSKHQSLQDSLTSLYTPPYSIKGMPQQASEAKKIDRFKTATHERRIENTSSSTSSKQIENEHQEISSNSSFWPLFLLSLAVNILTIGLLQFFFSDEGVLTLEWNSKFWFFYCLASIPLFFFGLKKANALK